MKRLVRPADFLTRSIARVTSVDNAIRVYFPERRDDFRDVVKRLCYHWDKPYWEKKVREEKQDRMSELVRDLLAAGFCVKVEEEIITAVRDGTFVEEPRRTVKATAERDSFIIWWGYYEDVEDAVKALPRISWIPNTYRTVLVAPEYYESVLDFATMNTFHVSKDAYDLADEAAREMAGAIVITPAPSQELASSAHGRVPPKLAEPDVAIPESLRDD